MVVPFYVRPPLPVASFGLYFGTGITVGATFGGGGWGGGGSSTIIYNHNTYINNHAWNNTNYNGPCFPFRRG
ncbi:MAG: hypothetical protein WA383_12370 [Terriglobales bacterium]